MEKEKSARYERDKKYEETHKQKRKEKSLNFGTYMPRKKAEEINSFLKEYGYTKVRLIEEGYMALQKEASSKK